LNSLATQFGGVFCAKLEFDGFPMSVNRVWTQMQFNGNGTTR
jgi:hypothetical protein